MNNLHTINVRYLEYIRTNGYLEFPNKFQSFSEQFIDFSSTTGEIDSKIRLKISAKRFILDEQHDDCVIYRFKTPIPDDQFLSRLFGLENAGRYSQSTLEKGIKVDFNSIEMLDLIFYDAENWRNLPSETPVSLSNEAYHFVVVREIKELFKIPALGDEQKNKLIWPMVIPEQQPELNPNFDNFSPAVDFNLLFEINDITQFQEAQSNLAGFEYNFPIIPEIDHLNNGFLQVHDPSNAMCMNFQKFTICDQPVNHTPYLTIFNAESDVSKPNFEANCCDWRDKINGESIICNHEFTNLSESEIADHIRTHIMDSRTPEMKYICKWGGNGNCKHIAENAYKLKRHMSKHLKTNRSFCDVEVCKVIYYVMVYNNIFRGALEAIQQENL
ncbi:hypothetical protein HK096_006981 [Nowakowskiella sp. JEL0078]|nr:hypothetical protein HK096_006981 [Nowakowskiella sp. JEL0078]